MTLRYISVNIFSNGPDCTNGGVSANSNNKFFVLSETGNWTEQDICRMDNAIVLELRHTQFMDPISGKTHLSDHFRPRCIDENKHSMFGGNFAYTSDSRFGLAYGRRPVHIHDRVE